ncbi:MAG TPA: hypothetical protein DCE71_08120 [Parachlamydiales bacterium]|nr:hypothetical protein [Parachlamydiales bacterium]
MKKHILTSILALASAGCFAIDTASVVEPLKPVSIPREQQINLNEKTSSPKGFLYVRMNVAEPQAHAPELRQNAFLPGLGIGYRRGTATALDISFSTSHIKNQGEESTFWAFPKMSYLRYFSPKKASSFYMGAGLTWGGLSFRHKETIPATLPGDDQTSEEIAAVETKREKTFFFGIIPTACVGYESNRQEAAWRSFVQLEVSQPTLAVKNSGPFPGPVAEFSVGLGY